MWLKQAVPLIFLMTNGKSKMAKIKICGNSSGQINIADCGSIINIFNSNTDLNNLRQELEQCILQVDKNKILLQEARTAIEQKNENKLKKVLKKIGPFLNNVISNFTTSLLFEYMKKNGLLIL